jgi:FkbM family methyltransferase
MTKNSKIKHVTFVKDKFNFTVVDDEVTKWENGFFWDMFSTSGWEPYTLEWIKEYSNKSGCFLDIGGWVGPTAIWASKYYQYVYAFEPDPVAYKSLKANSDLNADNILTYNMAVTSSDTSVKLLSRNGLGSSMTSMYTGSDTGMTVEGCPLLDVFELDKFSLIKIDIEGGERLLIDSLVEILSKNPINMIFSFHYGFYANPEEDFKHIINGLSKVYSKYILDDGTSIRVEDIPKGFPTVLCLAS